ncbi:hypothetical protein [Streptomyces sp. NPDC000410]|uniref:hypothetical protein n=1 Tax=Streptomyces sp. NPDC000410 TaxID=3154254 RepID=UPI00331A3883
MATEKRRAKAVETVETSGGAAQYLSETPAPGDTDPEAVAGPEAGGEGTPDVPLPAGADDEDARFEAEHDDEDAEGEEQALACHELLLLMAGKIPDQLITQCRAWLAEGRRTEVGSALAFAAAGAKVPLRAEDIDLLEELLNEADADTRVLEDIDEAEYEALPRYRFELTPDAEPRLSGPVSDETDAAVMAGCEDTDGAVGMWRTWRLPPAGAPWPPPRRVYVVEVEAVDQLIGATAHLQSVLSAVGEQDPQVEVYPTGVKLPSYQQYARNTSDLLWAASDDPGIDLVAVFDGVDPEVGPIFRTDHPRAADDEERYRMLAYLAAGSPLLLTTARMDDVVDRDLGTVVPMSYRTDGFWIWSDASAYYLETHGLLPAPELTEQMRSVGFTPPLVDGVSLHRAMVALTRPVDESPAWTYDGSSSGGVSAGVK